MTGNELQKFATCLSCKAYMKVYSITAFDNANDEPPCTTVFVSEDEAVRSVVDKVSQFASLHESDGDFSLNEIPDTLKDGCVYEFVSGDGFTYSWRMQSHTLIGV